MTVDPEELRRRAEELGIEFFFAQFVDMYARPSAKLVPAANWDSLITDGAGFAGFAAGEIGQAPTTRTSARSRTSTASRRCRGSRTWLVSPAM